MSDISPLGTQAFVLDEEALLVRVSSGWQYVALGSLVQLPKKSTTTTSTASPLLPPDSLRLDGSAPKIKRKLRVAALNQPWTGDLHGVRGADYECYRQSRQAHLRGTFRALLASRVQNLDSIVRAKDADLPLVNLKGEVVFNSWRELFSGGGGMFPYPPRIYSFDGRNVLSDSTWHRKMVWHGADVLGSRDMENYCDAWHSGAPARYGLASSLLGAQARLLGQERHSCASSFVVLCVEVTSQQHDQMEQQHGRRRRRHASNGGGVYGNRTLSAAPLERLVPAGGNSGDKPSSLRSSWEEWWRSLWPSQRDQDKGVHAP